MKVTSITETIHDLQEDAQNRKVEKKSGKRIGYNYIILKSIKESQKNDVIKCLYIKTLSRFGFCVIKEGSYGDTKDKQGRDIKDRLVWQKQLHEQLQNKVRIPRLFGHFEENGNYYLVLEYIKGKSLYQTCKENNALLRTGLLTGNTLGRTFLEYIIRIIDLLLTMHRHQIVHRDVTAANFIITPKGEVAVIDLELSYSIQEHFPTPPFQLGTFGYMSPQQEATQTPTFNEDIFSLGAIILFLWTGISPTKLTSGSFDTIANRVRFFIPDTLVADITLQCLHPNPDQRPSLNTVRQVISDYKNNIGDRISRRANAPLLFSKEQILETVQQAIETLATPLLADEKGWFTENRKIQSNQDKNIINKGWFASFHLGAAGVIYMLSQAKRIGVDVKSTLPYVQKGLALIDERYINRMDMAMPGIHFGCDGIAASLATAIQNNLVEPNPEYIEWISSLLEKESQNLGFMDGVAGQGIAQSFCYHFLPPYKIDRHLTKYVDHLLYRQLKDGSWTTKSDTKTNLVSCGFAHGIAGILYFLLQYAHNTEQKQVLEAAELGLQWLMRKAIHKNGKVHWHSTTGKEIPFWWCNGSAGVALTFIKAYQITRDPVYKYFAIKVLRNHDKTIINNNLSQCHGLSGLGEIYLQAYHTFNDEEWLDRAAWIQQVIMQMKKHDSKYGPYWLVETERQPVANFMRGNSGILHFLLRYYNLEAISFPLLPFK